MKKLTGALVVTVAAAVLLTGCVPVTYTRSVTVKKDANGNIVGIEEYEAITEPHSESAKIKELQGASAFKHLK